MTFAQRRAARRTADTERRAAQKQEPTEHDPLFYGLSYAERQAIRRREAQGLLEARELVKAEEKARKQAEYDATPEYLRRPDNIFHRLIAEWQSKSYRPDVARKIKEYKRLAAERDREIENEMADKLRQYEVESDPETKLAREHWAKASSGAENDEERQQWAVLRGRIDGGAAASYWEDARAILDARLQKIQQRMEEQIGKQAIEVGESKALATELAATEELQVKQEETPNESESTQTTEKQS